MASKIDSDPTTVVTVLSVYLLLFFISSFFERSSTDCDWSKTDAFKLDRCLLDRVIIVGIVTSAFASLLGCILAPIYYSADGGLQGIHAVSLHNALSSYTHRRPVWVVVPAAYSLTGMMCYFLQRESTAHLTAHLTYLKSLGTGSSNVLLDHLPGELRDSQRLTEFLASELGQETVVGVRICAGDKCAFVTLTSFRAVLDSREFASCVAKFVPDENDIIFENFGMYNRDAHQIAIDVGCILLLLYWYVPLDGLESILHNEMVRDQLGFPALPQFAQSFLEGYMPIGGLVLLTIGFYPFFEHICYKFEKRRCWSEIQSVVTQRIYAFFLMTIYVILHAHPIGIYHVIKSPENALVVLSEALAGAGMYFIYVMLGMIGFLTVFNMCVNVPYIWNRISNGPLFFPFEWVAPSLQFCFHNPYDIRYTLSCAALGVICFFCVCTASLQQSIGLASS